MTFYCAEVVDKGRIVRWSCDHRGCRANDDMPDNGDRVKFLLPPEWSSVLVTSMSDGNMAYQLCPGHTRDLHSAMRDGVDHHETKQAAGY